MSGIPQKLIECPRCGNVERIVGWDEYSAIRCPICQLLLIPAKPRPESIEDAAALKAGGVTGVSQNQIAALAFLPSLEDDDVPLEPPVHDAPHDQPETDDGFVRPIPKPRVTSPSSLPEYKRMQPPSKPLLYTPMIPGSFDPRPQSIVRGSDYQGVAVGHVPSLTGLRANNPVPQAPPPEPLEPVGENERQPGVKSRRTRNRKPTSRITIVLAFGAAIFIIGLVGWLVVQAFVSSRRYVADVTAAADYSEGYTARAVAAMEVARKFVDADGLEAKLVLVRDPERIRPLMEMFYTDNPPDKNQSLKTYGTEVFNGTMVFYHLAQNTEGHARLVCVVPTKDGMKVDWESYSRQGVVSKTLLFSGQPMSTKVRVVAAASNYYNYDYRDEAEWRAVELANVDWPTNLTGYVVRGSDVERQLDKYLNKKSGVQRLLLTIKVAENAVKNRQCEIEEVVAPSWIYPAIE